MLKNSRIYQIICRYKKYTLWAFMGCFMNTVVNILAIPIFSVTLANQSILDQTTNNFSLNPQLWLLNALEWINNSGSVGSIVFIILYILATIAFLPGSILTLGAGVVFGVIWGTVYVFIGATIGATGAFLVGRYMARDWIAEKIAKNDKFSSIDRAVGQKGFKIVLLTRLSPIFPFNLLNYAYGITGVSLKDYVIASVGMIPGTLMYVYIGSLAGSLATINTPATTGNLIAQWSMKVIGLIATVAVTLYVTKIAKKALDESVLTE